MGKRNRRILIAVLLFAVVQFAGYRAVSAYFTDRGQKNNSVSAGINSVEAEEPFDPPKPGEKTVKAPRAVNTGSVDCYVRGRIVLSDSRAEKFFDYYTDDNEGFNLSKWQEGADGWLYYKDILKVGQKTDPVFTHIRLNDGAEAEGGLEFDLDVMFESVQSDGFSDYKAAFQSIEGRQTERGGSL